MSDETESSPEISPASPAAPAPRARKTATRARKAAKTAKPASASKEKPEAPAETPAEQPKVVVDPTPAAKAVDHAAALHDVTDSQDASAEVGADWPEPDGESSGGAPSQGEGGKRKRRRRKGKGQGGQGGNDGNGGSSGSVGNVGHDDEDESAPAVEHRQSDSARDQAPRPSQQQPQQQPQRPRVNPDKITKMAWKIYLAEVSEEGVALIGDNDAKDLSRRCFRLAEIFIEEQSRRR